MGSSFAKSPHLDRLAQEGVLFQEAHTASPVCAPARCSLLTGMHTHVHGCIENGNFRRTDLPVFPDFLKEQGYWNIMVGKTHFDPVPESFDVKHITGEKGSNIDDCYTAYLQKYGIVRTEKNILEEHFLDKFLVDTAIMEMDEAVDEEKGPFFTFCSLVSPHSPVDPPGEWAHLYDSMQLPPLNYRPEEERNYPEHLRRLVGKLDEDERSHLNEILIHYADSHCGIKEIGVEYIDKLRRLYYGLAAFIDHQVGRLLEYLDKKGLRKNTLIIFSSDHGQEYFDHGFNNKHNYHDASWRVPLIMSMPGTLPLGETREFAVWTDIPATILGAAGTDCFAFQGFDLFTPLSKGLPSPRKYAVGTLYKSAAVATNRWKLEYYFEEGIGRLYDRKSDPSEQQDLYKNEAYKEIRERLVKALLRWRADALDVWYLRKFHSGGGPVAKRLEFQTMRVKGIDAEERLQAELDNIEVADWRLRGTVF
jgi:arylsulfatase A-like enzyme